MKLMSCDRPTLTRVGDGLTTAQLATLDIKSLIVCVPRATMSEVQWEQIMALTRTAPDLLAALCDAQQALEHALAITVGAQPSSRIALSYAQDKARAAIAKAKGGAK